MFKGSITALITPFKNGEIDWTAFDKLIEWQIAEGIHGLVPCGTTGESPTLSHAEHREVNKRCIDVTAGRVPVIAGAGSNCTKEAIEMALHAKEDGADAVLVTMPYYNKPTQEGMYQHYKAINDEAAIPMIIYNIPGRSVVDMSVDTMARLAKLPHIVGVKDATDDGSRPVKTRLACGEDFCQLSGEDPCVAAFYGQGGHGIISVISNVAPKLSAQRHEAWEKGDMATFAKLRDQLAPLASAAFYETSPAPIKYAASKLGLCANELRLPMVPASEGAMKAVDAAMKAAGLV